MTARVLDMRRAGAAYVALVRDGLRPLVASSLVQRLEAAKSNMDRFAIIVVGLGPLGLPPDAMTAWLKRHGYLGLPQPDGRDLCAACSGGLPRKGTVALELATGRAFHEECAPCRAPESITTGDRA